MSVLFVEPLLSIPPQLAQELRRLSEENHELRRAVSRKDRELDMISFKLESVCMSPLVAIAAPSCCGGSSLVKELILLCLGAVPIRDSAPVCQD